MKDKIKPYLVLFIVILAISLIVVPFFIKNRHRFHRPISAESSIRDKTFEEQIKLSVADKRSLERVSNTKRILSYKSKSLGKYYYQDYYYDTPSKDLFRYGYSYRFRIRDKGDGNIIYALQFKKEYSEDEKSFVRVEVDENIPEELGKKILAGEWSLAFSNKYNIRPISEIRKFLASHNINSSDLLPILYGKLYRDRFRLKEKRVTFFEISLDEATFEPVNNKDKVFSFMEVEFENKYEGGYIGNNVEIDKRIHEILDFFSTEYNMKVTMDSKYRQAVEYLGK